MQIVMPAWQPLTIIPIARNTHTQIRQPNALPGHFSILNKNPALATSATNSGIVFVNQIIKLVIAVDTFMLKALRSDSLCYRFGQLNTIV